ncbi:MAG: hypothetical protein QY325_09310 [Flavobacteriales bacterium]|nr:MAG: hypothetical protein QY325_09310 [Flavobacteriales bacterium]
MFTGGPSIESPILPYREWAVERGNPLQRASKAYMEHLLAVLQSRKQLPKAVAALRNEQFALRIKALEWLAQDGFDLEEWQQRKERELKAHEHAPGLELLVLNMRFALQAGADVFRGLKAKGVDLENMDKGQVAAMDGITFEQFEAVINLAVPHGEAAHMILTWLYASMDMEAGLLMGEAVLEEDVRVSAARVEDLNAFLVPAAQTYAACARLMRLVPVNEVPAASLVQQPAPKGYIRQQQQLAELGIADWFKQWA